MMTLRLAILGTLLLLAGCSGMIPYTLPGDIEHPPEGESEIRLVKMSMNAVVTLKSGEVVKGEVLDVTTEMIILGKHSNYGYQENTYLAADIERIESEKPPSAGQIILGTVAFIGSLFAIVVVWFMLDPPNFG